MFASAFFLCFFLWTGPSGVELQNYRFSCDENFCSSKVGPCPELHCDDGRLIKNATQCGCCEVCVKSLGQGAACSNEEYAVIPTAECGDGLVCEDGVCAPAKTKCILDRLNYDSSSGIGELTTGQPRPDCDYFGFYKPVSCKPGMLCFCVDKEGNRIFGTDSSSNKDQMNCSCSRDHAEFPRTVVSGQFLRCLPNGDYDPLQCTDRFCYCMGDDDHLDGRPVQSDDDISHLKCYHYKRHKDIDNALNSKCLRERNALTRLIIEDRAQGVELVGLDLPPCDLDGSYAPVQCNGDRCNCVKKDGSLYEEGYSAPRKSESARNMNCRCAREKDMLREEEKADRVTQVFAQYRCGPNGDYLPVQCVGSVCFCVDPAGFQSGEAVLMYKHASLPCYRREYERFLE